MGAWTFHRAVIGGLAFEGLVSAEGPSISCRPSRDPLSGGGVALVVSGVRRFAPERIGRAAKPEGWWIVKYRDEERIFLPGFTPADIERMTAEFGLVAVSVPEWSRAGPFLRSRAWSGLVEWVAMHPRRAARAAGWDAYLPGWVEHARAAAASRPGL